MLAEVPLCRALGWLEDAEQFPSGPHSAFGREVKKLEPATRRPLTMSGGMAANGYGQRASSLNGSGNGNGQQANGSNGSHVELLRLEDL